MPLLPQERRIREIKRELAKLPAMRPGTLSEQYNTCGQPNCRCKDKREPFKHGPYLQLSYSFRGRSHTEFVRREELETVQAQLVAYARFRELTEEWIALSIEIAKEERSAAKHRATKEVHHG